MLVESSVSQCLSCWLLMILVKELWVFWAWTCALDDYIGSCVWKFHKHCCDILLTVKVFGKKVLKVRSLKKAYDHWKFLLSMLWYGYSESPTAKTHWLPALCCMVMTFPTDVHIILLYILILLVSKLYTPYDFFEIVRSMHDGSVHPYLRIGVWLGTKFKNALNFFETSCGYKSSLRIE